MGCCCCCCCCCCTCCVGGAASAIIIIYILKLTSINYTTTILCSLISWLYSFRRKHVNSMSISHQNKQLHYHSYISSVVLENSPKPVMIYTMTVFLLVRNKQLLTSQFCLSISITVCTMQLSASPFYYYLLEHFNIICANSLVTEKNSTEPQNIITWISSLEIPDEPPCCVRQCGTSFPFIF